MDFFFRNLEAAQEQARNLTLSAGQSAKALSEHLTEHTKTLAEQAANVSTAAAEQASQRWKGLNIQEALQLKALQNSTPGKSGVSREELEQYAVTPDLIEFIRSLTYSTFRDFPLEQLPGESDGNNLLTPWQEKHALYVVQEVKEINELRFVLCPKRMNDAQFWLVYFTLTKKFLPPEAFDPQHRVAETAETRNRMQDLHSGLRRTLESAKETAREWSSRASGGLRAAEVSEQLHDLVESRSRGNTPKAVPRDAEQSENDSHPFKRDPCSATEAESDLDYDLEAYLQTIANDEKEKKEAQDDCSENSEGAANLEDYLNELTTANSDKQEDDSEDAVDIDEYMKEMDERY